MATWNVGWFGGLAAAGRWRMVQRRLGRGLDFLLSGAGEPGAEEVVQVEVTRLRPNPFQPRRAFPPEELEELAASIREHGVLQPVIVRVAGEGYELIVGERRWRACQRLGLATLPALVRAADDTQMLEIALVENLQRQDLDPIEEARAYAAYVERLDLTQEQAAQRLGRSRAAVANTMRLLDLPADLQELVSRGTLSMGHARALLALADVEAQRALARRIEAERVSVREVENLVRRAAAPAAGGRPARAPNAYLAALEDQLKERFGTRVTIHDRQGAGRVVIEYYSHDDFTRLLEILLEARAPMPFGSPPVLQATPALGESPAA